MTILFMGTPDFAVPSLEALIAAGHTICGVFTPVSYTHLTLPTKA